MYVDETGDLDLSGKVGSSSYFGIGSAVISGQHDQALWSLALLRFHLAEKGVDLPRGFHAKNDSAGTRHEVFQAIDSIAPRFDFTMIAKSRLYPNVLEKGEEYLYRLAWHLHFKEIAPRVSARGDKLFVAVGTLGTARRKTAASRAVQEVCSQVDRSVVVASWPAETSFGIQVADYGLWSVQRDYERADASWYDRYAKAHTESNFDIFNRQWR